MRGRGNSRGIEGKGVHRWRGLTNLSNMVAAGMKKDDW